MRNLKFKNEYIKDYKPTTPSLRNKRTLKQPKKLLRIKNLSKIVKSHGGRNNTGRITARHRGCRHKRYSREIDYVGKNASYGLSSLLSVENDPNRPSNIGRYFSSLFKGYYVISPGESSDVIQGPKYVSTKYLKDGDTVCLKDIPAGFKCYNIQSSFNTKPKLVRSSGCSATIIKRDSYSATLRLPSKKEVKLNKYFVATVGEPSNASKNLTKKGKAGASR
jgi:large subunit ribosomal protein L2